MLSLVALWAGAVGLTMTSALEKVAASTTYNDIGGPAGYLARHIEIARTLSTVYLAGNDGVRADLLAQRARTDAIEASFRKTALSSKPRAAADPVVRRRLEFRPPEFGSPESGGPRPVGLPGWEAAGAAGRTHGADGAAKMTRQPGQADGGAGGKSALTGGPAGPEHERSPEASRDLMDALQVGWTRGREADDDDDPRRPDGGSAW